MNRTNFINPTNRLVTLKVVDVMSTNVVSLPQTETMATAAETFRVHGITSAPVVDDEGRCIGVVSASDFLHPEYDHDINLDVLAKNMSASVQMVPASAPLLQAARIMNSTHLHHLPVLDEQQRIVGVVSTLDIVAAVVNAVDESEAGIS